jgi:hypothetical protein
VRLAAQRLCQEEREVLIAPAGRRSCRDPNLQLAARRMRAAQGREALGERLQSPTHRRFEQRESVADRFQRGRAEIAEGLVLDEVGGFAGLQRLAHARRGGG